MGEGLSKAVGGIFPEHEEAHSDPELDRLKLEQRAREKKLQDIRLQMLRRRSGGSPGIQPQPNQPQQTLG
jgi:hypothetical protein